MKAKIAVLFLFLFTLITSFAQKDYTFAPDDFATAPIVPVEVMIGGRQEVTEYLLKQVSYVTATYTGDSVIGDSNNRFISKQELASNGYLHTGSFTEMSDAIAQTRFTAQIMRTPRGNYDVRAEIKLHSFDDRIVMIGWGNLQIIEGKGGLLNAEDFQPWISIPENVLVKNDKYINGAKYLSKDGSSQEIEYQNRYVVGGTTASSYIKVPTGILGEGFLMVADDSGRAKGWDLKFQTLLFGEAVIAKLGKIMSSDVISLTNPQSIFTSQMVMNINFSKDGDLIYGRFPIIDIIVPGGIKEYFLSGVHVWGSDEIVYPTAVYVNAIFGDTNKAGSLPLGKDVELVRAPNGGYTLDLPPGGYHIKVRFSRVLDWSKGGKG